MLSGGTQKVTVGMAVFPHLPQRYLKRIVGVLAVVAVGMAATTYFGYRQLTPPPEVVRSPKAEAEAMVVERVHQSATRDGRTEWSLDAATAQYRLPEKKVLLTDPRVTFFTRDDQKVFLTARQATVMADSHDMEVRGQVVIYNEAYRLETEKMVYSHDARTITTDAPVRITGLAGDLMADSLVLDLNANRLVMRGHVHGILASTETR
jgi:LPS export ABC transporter protein LptC